MGAEGTVRWGGGTSPNMVSSATNLPDDLQKVKPLWMLPLGTHQYSIPTVDGGDIFVTTNDLRFDRPGTKSTGGGVLMCVDRSTGKPKWRFRSPRFKEGVVDPYHYDQWECGFASGPVLDGDRVYLVGNRGEILCLDRQGQANGNEGPFVEEAQYMQLLPGEGEALRPDDGDLIWRYDLVKELDVVPHDVCGSTLLMRGNLLYASTSNGIDGPHKTVPHPDAPTLIVLDKRTGRLVARDGELIGRRMLHCNWASPVYGEVNGQGRIFFGAGDGFLYAFEPVREDVAEVQTLKKVWAYDCNPENYRTKNGQLVPYSSSGKNTPEGPSEIIGTPVFYENRVYALLGQSPLHGPGQGNLVCVDAATGQPVWTSNRVNRSLATVSVADGLLYAVDCVGQLFCFDAKSGDLVWSHNLEGKVWSASTFVADGKVYAGTETNQVWVLKAGREKQVLSRTRVGAMPITPTAVDGILYLPTQTQLIAYPGGK